MALSRRGRVSLLRVPEVIPEVTGYGLVGTGDALHQQLARPEFAQPVEVVPAEAGIHLPVHHGGLHLDIRGIGGHEVPKLRHAIEQEAEQPPRMREAVM
jgi:hypothetical protein